ncbi:MAG: hypothetical protein ACTS7E_01490 [Arsenophonus sp. NC-CH8-MAG3]
MNIAALNAHFICLNISTLTKTPITNHLEKYQANYHQYLVKIVLA